MPFQVRRVSSPRPRRLFPWKRLAVLLTIARPVVLLYESWKKRHEEVKQHEHRTLLLKRIAIILISVLFALLLLAGTVQALISLKVLTVRSLLNTAGTSLPRDEKGFTNMLILGVGDKDHDGVDLTDTMIIASIDPTKTKSTLLLSLPRDLYLLKTENMGKGRINSLFRDYKIDLKRSGMKEPELSIEAMKELGKEIGNQIGITIHGVVKADFTAFEKAVDTIGGIDVTVPYNIVDTEYPDLNYGFSTFQIAAGLQHLDGATALKYVRSRHTTSDFGRSARQQDVLVAIGNTIKAQKLYTKPGTIMDMWKIFSDHVQMTVSLGELISLAGAAEGITPDRIITMQLNDRSGLFGDVTQAGGFLYTPPRDQFDGAAVLLPVSIPEFPITWKQIRLLVSFLQDHRDLYLKKPSIAILNVNAKSGLGRKLGNELIRYGFNVTRIENAKVSKADVKASNNFTSVLGGPLSEPVATNFFSTLFGTPTVPNPVPAPPDEQRANVTIMLWKDYVYQPLQNLVPDLAAPKSPIPAKATATGKPQSSSIPAKKLPAIR
ncbi:MAG: LCP family protein [Candidatus Peregrinibacteria bacterium]